MRKILFAIIGAFVLASLIQNASANHYSYGRNVVDLNRMELSEKNYRYSNFHRNYYDYDLSNRAKKIRAGLWTIGSYDYRYRVAAGRTTGDVFGEEGESSSSNWRNKLAYANQDNGRCSYKTKCYYNPRFDQESGTWNWRY